MSHPYPKPILPKWPVTPILPAPQTHAGFFLSPSDPDGRVDLWGYREWVEESQDYIHNQVPGTHEARSAQFLLASVKAQTGELFQVQDTPDLTTQGQQSTYWACATARMIGCGLTGYAGGLHFDPGPKLTPITGGAFSNDNYLNGQISFHGITSDEVLGLFRNMLTDFIRKGGIVE
jgi:hypothetical protein